MINASNRILIINGRNGISYIELFSVQKINEVIVVTMKKRITGINIIKNNSHNSLANF